MSAQHARGATGVFFLVNSDCSGCATIISKSLKKIEGIRKVGINYVTDKVYVSFDPSKVTSGEIREAIEKAGYRALEMSHVKEQTLGASPS